MSYHPHENSPQQPRSGRSRHEYRPDDAQDFESYETAGYDAPSYDPSSYETQELWGENRNYRQDEGYSDRQDFRGNRDYRTTQEDFRSQRGLGQSDQEPGFRGNYSQGSPRSQGDYMTRSNDGRHRGRDSFAESGREPWGLQQGLQRGSQQSRPSRDRDYPQHSAQYAGLQQSPNYQSNYASGDYERFPQRASSNFGTAQRQYAGDEAINERSRWGGNPYASRQPQFAGGEGQYRQAHGAGTEWQDNPSRREGNYGRSQFDTHYDDVGDYGLHRSFGGPGGDNYAGRRQVYRGNSPKGYERSDERIREDVCEHLTHDPRIDAGDITVNVKAGIVTLEGSVTDRGQKYRVEDIADDVSGVKDVQNRLSVARQSRSASDQGRDSQDRGTQDSDLGKNTTQKVTRQ